MMKLSNNISVLPGIGQNQLKSLVSLGLIQLRMPYFISLFRYEDFEVKSVFDLQDGEKLF